MDPRLQQAFDGWLRQFERELVGPVSDDALDRWRKKIVRELDDAAEAILAAALSHQQSLLARAEELSEEGGDALDALEDAFQTPVAPPDNRDAFFDALDRAEQLARSTPVDNDAIRDKLRGLADDELLSDQDLDDFLDGQNGVAPAQGSGPEVRELRDRYYRIEGGVTAVEPPAVERDGIPLASLGGWSSVRFEGDQLVAEDGDRQVRFNIAPPSRRSGQGRAPNVSIDADAVRDDFAHESWGCQLRSVLDTIIGQLERVQSLLREAYRSVRQVVRRLIERPISAVQSEIKNEVMRRARGLVGRLKQLDQIEQAQRLRVGAIATVRQLSFAQAPSQTATCDKTLQTYCEIDEDLEALLDALSVQVDSLVFPAMDDLSQKLDVSDTLEELADAYLEGLEELEVALDTGKRLRKKLCRWIRQARKGVPSEVRTIDQTRQIVLVAIRGALASLDTALNVIEVDQNVEEARRQFRQLGLDRAADALGQGDLLAVSAMQSKTATHAHEIETQLEQRASQTSSQPAAIALRAQAGVARAKRQQAEAGIQIRQNLYQRRRQGRARHIARLKEIAREAIAASESQFEGLRKPPTAQGSVSAPPRPPSGESSTPETPPVRLPPEAARHVAEKLPDDSSDVTITHRVLAENQRRACLEVTAEGPSGTQVVYIELDLDRGTFKELTQPQFGRYA